MKKFSLIYLGCAFMVLLSSGCERTLLGCVSGEGSKETRVVDFDTIEGFDVFGSNNITIIEGDEQLIEITSFPNLIDLWLEDSRVQNGILKAGVDRCISGFNDAEIEIVATIAKLKEVSISGSGDVKTQGTFENVDDLVLNISGSGDMELDLGDNMDEGEIQISGSGDIEMSGLINELSVRIAGSGDLMTFGLSSLNTNLIIAGSGDAEVTVEENFDVVIMGSGDVCYRGNPSITTDISGSGNIRNCN